MTEIVAQPINHVFETAEGRRISVKGQCSEILGEFIISDLFRQAAKVQTDEGDSAQVVVESTLALTAKVNLLPECFVHFLKTIDSQKGFFDNGRFGSFFS